MTDAAKPEAGTIGWHDLTVENAGDVRDFYHQVVGWTFSETDMGGYSDFCMNTPAGGESVAGICHARGTNTGLPAQWLMYINVDDVDASIARCEALGGTVLAGPKTMSGHGRYCIIQDPAGAVAALFAPA
ncbi:MAG: VOC family protein [Planctomycetota bacterium]|jgi:predicted enzyme related to lactoylglutathione lyase